MTNEPLQVREDPHYRTFRRMTLRRLGVVVRMLEPPRECTFLNNLLAWKPPEHTDGITHYRIRIERDGGDPDYEVPSGQLALQVYRGDTFAISSYNKTMDLESRPVIVGADYTLDSGNVGLEMGPQGLAITNISASLTAPTDFGLRWWAIEVSYTSTLEGLEKVEIWVENPKDAQPEKIGEATYTGAGAKAYFPMEPPASNTEIRVYLVPITAALVYPLRTVADYPGSPSANDTTTITPVSTDDLGKEYCANVTNWNVDDTPETFYDANGVKRLRFQATFTVPSDARWGGVWAVIERPGNRRSRHGPFRTSPSDYVIADLPLTQETWRVFGQSQDKFGKRNSINETQEGEATPYEDISVGTTAGSLDLGKALETSISEAMDIIDNVFGVASGGITTELIGIFAVSKEKLKNAKIIDGIRIEDAAVTTIHIENAAITNLLVQNGAIKTEKIGDEEVWEVNIKNLAVTTGKVNNLNVNKVVNWENETIDVGAGLTFSGNGGITMTNGGSVVVTSPGHMVAGLYLNIVPSGGGGLQINSTTTIDQYGKFVHSSGVDTSGTVAAGDFKIGASAVINGSKQFVGSGGVSSSGDINTTGVFKKGGTQVVGAQQSHIADASTSHSFGDLAAAEAGCNALGSKINSILSALETHGLLASA